MKAREIVFKVLKVVVALTVIMVIVMAVIKFSAKVYDFGFRIFGEEAMTPAPGYTTSVAITEGKSVMEIGEILEEKKLIRDAKLFYFQELVSDYHGMLKPGVYELSTAMTPEEMMEIMAGSGDDGEVSGNSESTSENSISDNMAAYTETGEMADPGLTEETVVTEE
ncbi:MAG: endolytic transglycosylase MltG [Lachnospiraceae bacterium]|nr:endolytic transglycosylase MltG [Lachnospiraceae bacterium]